MKYFHRDRFRANLGFSLKTFGLLRLARRIMRGVKLLFRPDFRRRECSNRKRFREFKRRYGGILEHNLNGSDQKPKRALVLTMGPWVEKHLCLIKALELAGFVPVVLITDVYQRGLLSDYYSLTGAKEIYVWEDFTGPPNFSAAEAVIDRCGSIQDLRSFKCAGARVGQFTFSTALRELRIGSLDIKTPQHRPVLVKYLASAMTSARTAERLIQKIRPHLALLVDGAYTPEGEFFDLCLANGIDTLLWNMGHKSNTLMLKRYKVSTRDEHPRSLSAESWQFVRQMEWTESHRAKIQHELYNSYASGDWHSHVGTQFDKKLTPADEIRTELSLDPATKTAVIFPHIPWDASLSRGDDLFDGYEEWLIETVRAACANDRVNWIIKIHPANVGKRAFAGLDGEPVEVVVLRKQICSLPPHVFLLPAEHPMSTLSIFDVMDYCVTVRGTAGIEAARLGIPVLNGGTGRYSQKGFTLDPASREEYLAYIAHIHDIPRLSSAQQELADRFAYGTFILRPLALKTVTSERPSKEYQKRVISHPNVKINIKSKEDWYRAPDLKAFARWVNSKDTDFLMPLSGGDDAPR